MPSEDKKLCLLQKSTETDSGLEICGYLWTVDCSIYITDSAEPRWGTAYSEWCVFSEMIMPKMTMLIDFSPFKDKNGRLLKEGDEVVLGRLKCEYTVCQREDDQWYLKGIDDLTLHSTLAAATEYTNSIYLKGD